MAVYVDDVALPFGNMIMCHMWADSDEELLEMADRIGVQRKWIQGHPTLSFGKHREASWVHFDIAASKKRLAMQCGATLTDRYGPAAHTASLRMAEASKKGDEETAAKCRHMLDQIARMRARG